METSFALQRRWELIDKQGKSTPLHSAAEGATAGHHHGPHCGDWKPGDPDWIEVTHELDPETGMRLPAHNGEIVPEAREEAIATRDSLQHYSDPEGGYAKSFTAGVSYTQPREVSAPCDSAAGPISDSFPSAGGVHSPVPSLPVTRNITAGDFTRAVITSGQAANSPGNSC
jgi:hypothetical protein